jgi:uncharacterized damage-inducible protein DinB
VLAVELTPATASRYVHLALDELLAVADRLGDAKVNERPISRHTNAVANLILHCCGVTEFWLGHVGLGRDSHRDRDSEFTRTATIAELHAAVEAARTQVDADLVALDAGATSPFADGRAFLTGGDESDASLVLHVLEELYQHLGHCELAADALTAD